MSEQVMVGKQGPDQELQEALRCRLLGGNGVSVNSDDMALEHVLSALVGLPLCIRMTVCTSSETIHVDLGHDRILGLAVVNSQGHCLADSEEALAFLSGVHECRITLRPVPWLRLANLNVSVHSLCALVLPALANTQNELDETDYADITEVEAPALDLRVAI